MPSLSSIRGPESIHHLTYFCKAGVFPPSLFFFYRQELENGLQLSLGSPQNKSSERGIIEEENKDDKEGCLLINMIALSARIIYYRSVADLLSPNV